MTVLVQLTGVSKAYQSALGAEVVLSDLDLTIHAGEKISLMGPSGCGKSTLLAMIAGLMMPDEGTVEIDGIALDRLGDRDRAKIRSTRIGIALQSQNLIPFLSAAENVELALGFGFGRKWKNRSRAHELLQRMDVIHRRESLPRQLSGGEAQRVALAVALANEPALLLADEMASALDPTTATTVVDEIFGSTMAVLFVTHTIALAERAERQLCLASHRLEPR